MSEQINGQQLLRDPDIIPTNEIIAEGLGAASKAYARFVQELAERYDIGLMDWRYYNDGKAWLGKCVHKKKTVFWLSVWNGYFMVTLYFNEKTGGGVYELPISDDIKTSFTNQKSVGKLLPLLLEVYDESVLEDAYTVIEYKRNLK